MLKKIILATTFGALTNSISFAAPLLHFSKHAKINTHKLQSHEKNQSQNYFNFSGQWQGTCQTEDGVFPLLFKIDHEGSWLFVKFTDEEGEITSEEYQIGGWESHSSSYDAWHDVEHNYAYWDRSGKSLIIESVRVEKGDSVYSPLVSYTEVSRSALSLKDNQLTVQITSHSFEDGQAFGPEGAMCTLSKVENIK